MTRRSDVMAAEARMYWQLSTALKMAERNGDRVEQAECLEELDVVSQYTGWPLLQALCFRAVFGAPAKAPDCVPTITFA